MLQPSLGIIGGAGPIAGAQLFQNIIRVCQDKYGCHQDADFPYIFLLNYPFSDMLSDSNNAAVLQHQLNDCFKTFSKCNVRYAAIACNTLHAFLNSLDFNGVTLIHMIEETKNAVMKSDVGSTIVLCTNTSIKYRIHASKFNCFYPKDFQDQVQHLIDIVLAGKQSAANVHKLVQKLNELSKNTQVDDKKIGLVLGCTEFSVLHEQFSFYKHGLSDKFVIFDANQLIVNKICEVIMQR